MAPKKWLIIIIYTVCNPFWVYSSVGLFKVNTICYAVFMWLCKLYIQASGKRRDPRQRLTLFPTAYFFCGSHGGGITLYIYWQLKSKRKVSSLITLKMRATQSSANNLTNTSKIRKLKIKGSVLASTFSEGHQKLT